MLYHFAFPPAMNESFYFSVSLSAFVVVGVLDLGHSNSFVVISHYSNLHIPDDISCVASFHKPSCHLCIFFGAVSLAHF